MAIERILRAIEAETWLIQPQKLDAIMAVIVAKANSGQIPTANDIVAASDRQRAGTKVQGSVAVIPLMGTISQRMGMMDAMSGGASLEAFSDAFRTAMADESVGAIMIRIDSPGGSVFGIEEAGRMIAAGAKKKRVVAMVDASAGSAAYWLATQAGEIALTPSGQVGSIGAYMVHFDRSAQMEADGVKATIIKAGDHKAEGNPYEGLDPEAAAHLQTLVDAYDAAFTKAVAKGRGVTAEAVKASFGQGRMFDAKRALKLGMVDRIASYDEMIADMAGGKSVSTVRAIAQPSVTSDDLDIAASTEPIAIDALVAAALGTLRILTHQPVTAGAHAAPETITIAPTEPAPKAKEQTMDAPSTAAQPTGPEAVAAERLRAKQIREIAKTHGFEAKADAWVDAGMSVEAVNAAILDEMKAKAKIAPQVRTTTTTVHGVQNRAENDPRRGFNHHREFFGAVIDSAGARERDDVRDDRLKPLAVSDKDDKQAGGELAFMMPAGFDPRAAVGSDEQGGYSDSYGGFAIPTTRSGTLLERGFEGDPTAGMTQDIPMQTPSVEIMARTDSDHTTSVSGGFTVARKAEAAAAAASRTQLEMVTLKASSLFGLAYATEEILTDSPMSFAAIIDAGFRTQFGAYLLNEKIRGLGGDQYLGVLNSPAAVSVAKESGQGAASIVAKNAIKMAARAWHFGSSVWLANHDCKPDLYSLSIAVGTAGTLIYQPSRDVGFPDMLLGRPVFYTEYASTIGTVGDFMLIDWSQFLEGTYQPIQGAESVHVRFVNHERAFKLWTRNCGAPWWRAPLTPAKSTATLSPIVTLATRA